MTISRRDDLTYTILMITAVYLYSSICADPLYIGLGYLLAVPAVALIPGLILRAPALFLTGTTVTPIATLLIYMKIMSVVVN